MQTDHQSISVLKLSLGLNALIKMKKKRRMNTTKKKMTRMKLTKIKKLTRIKTTIPHLLRQSTASIK